MTRGSLFTLLALLGCTPQAEDPAVFDPATLSLPHSSTAAPAIDDLPLVVVTKTKLVVPSVARASLPLPIGVESTEGPIIVPLRDWVRGLAAAGGHDIALAIDGTLTSGLALQVLATCMDVGFTTFHLAVMREGETAQIPLVMGKADPPDAKLLTISLFRDGVIVKVPAGTIAPGCDGIAEGVTMSRGAGMVDREKLGKCVEHIHVSHPTNTASVVVPKDSAFSDLVMLVDIVRHDAATESIALGLAP